MPLDQTWPITLPDNFLQSGYQEGNINNIVETSMDEGPTKRRKKNTRAYKPITGKMTIDTTQKAIFQNFFTEDIAYGALPFTMPTYGGGTVDVYLDNHSVVPRSGTLWTLSMNIRALV